jgi:outer membrane protein TolC
MRNAKTFCALTAALVLSACTVVPKPAQQVEVAARVKDDTAKMFVNQDPISGPITMEEAVARALKYNLDYRLKKMESALALGLSEYANFDMLPKLLVNAGYRTRNNDSGGSSIGIVDRFESLRPSTSEERNHRVAGAEFSWNLLDFGVSYYRAKQQADEFLIYEERRRKVVQNLLQDVRASHWRALGAQRMETQVKAVLERANYALARSREAEVQKIVPPALALNYQRALLDAISMLNQRRQDLAFAKSELAALMNVPVGVDFTLADAAEVKLPAAPTDARKFEELALLQRPELREEDFKKRITADETRKQLASLLPGISLNAGVNYDSNRFMYNNNWSQGGINIFWNLLRLTALPSMNRAREAQVKTDEARRLALSMAVITQLRVAVDRYRLALEDFNLADKAAQVDERLEKNMRASVTARLESELEAIRVQARAALGAYQRANAYANAQVAFGRLYNTLGYDPMADDFEADDLRKLTERVRRHLSEAEQGALPMKSNLFVQAPAVSLHFAGVTDAVMLGRMAGQVGELLTRNEIVVDAQRGVPLAFVLTRDDKTGLEAARWDIKLSDAKGQTVGTTHHTTTVPREARGSVYEATLIAATTQALPRMKAWLAAPALQKQ